MTGLPVLSALWLVPLIGALAVIAVPPTRSPAARAVGLTTSCVVLILAVLCAIGFEAGAPGYQFVEQHEWIPSFGAGYTLGIDGIALTLVLLTAVLVPILLLAGWNDTPPASRSRRTHTYVALILVVESMVMVSFVSLDILLFYLFFEAMLVPMYFLIGGFGRDAGRARSAAVTFLLYNLAGGLVMLAAVIGLYVVTASDASPFSAGTFDLRAIADAAAAGELGASPGVLNALFLGFLVAFAVKAPLWPLHTWLPGAATESTPATAVLMMAVVDKVGTFGMLRYCLQLFPESSATFAPVVITLAVVGIVYGAVLAIGATDIMRLIAYTSISHFGFIILGIFAMTSQSQAGSALYMVNHGIATAALFLVAGFLVTRRGSALIADHGGVQKVAPVLAGTFLVAGLATLSLPGLAPFVSEFLVLVGTFPRYGVAAVIAASALVLSAVYVLWLYQRVMTGPVAAGSERIRDLVPREIAVVAPLLVLVIALGVYPRPALDILTPAVERTSVEQLETGVAAP
ncbi:NADH-quinone oxidoreductase subunit M [Rhodococcus sp. BP-349]|uniref:NADH-quinone oxidoreductase subunit M n=1 Tax=unclassified Rhodococcus (in: high G+C Gram-positive bacteria) TaxID=192944 RepID=UPI001C9AD145|nr:MULTISPECIES: NADH-quinone oxidoreductase subunit M [unclassified Rhodococcus (in: high G+C Gram-positive bacteria)]MBY6539258.1 NADH-quinone oxidoreductase subunit M [Rhodococcus sp. BP-363]MBY6544414.1 NADH-quinone oxidoreductase subunit M [Rhodococcus sp. BP-369]MBY6563644.1 NADH-quinone oxidoreductase subunit M [Rhodococcus sp. BP-370]MBY6577936.1 NADH-quinone oxidoreductase subunit M [Rhodococcus sp. BP-364]MBY6587237.1 NADH-quinone oxidoreductase subunit M [Rhodococcus sp. BP-358]